MMDSNIAQAPGCPPSPNGGEAAGATFQHLRNGWETVAPAAPGETVPHSIPAGQPGLNWFSDLRFHWDASITVRKTGVKITLKELTASELSKFFVYLGMLSVQAMAVRLSGQRRYTVWFTPDRPRPWYVIWSAAALAGIRFARSADDADAVFYFEDVTAGTPPRVAGRKMLNAGVTDISKTRVAEAFGRVAGYDLALDPMTHEGKAVEKSEVNGKHDGRLVDCPVSPQPGKSYQRFIDSSDGATAFDYRTTIVDRRPQFVLVKTKPADDRFSIHNVTVAFRELADVFSADEIGLIRRFAEEMQLDWGAFDVLRDRGSGRIYIVDVNKTDTGPAVDLSLRCRGRLKRAIATAFRKMIAEAAATWVADDMVTSSTTARPPPRQSRRRARSAKAEPSPGHRQGR